MFSKNIQTTSLVGNVANQFFTGFPVEGTFSRDFSFAAVMRALLYHRISEGSGVKLVHRDSSLREGDIRGVDPKIVLGSIMGDKYTQPDCLTLCNVNGRPEDNEKIFAIIDGNFVNINNDFTEHEDLKRFSSENMNARFYTNPATRTTVIVVDRMTMPRYHLLQAIMPRFFPWYFAGKPLDADEKKLMIACTKKSSDDFEAILENLAQTRFDLRRMTISALIGDFERKSRKTQLEEAKRNLERINDELRENRETHERLIRDRDERMIRYEGVRAMINGAGDSTALVEYCMENKNLTIVDTSDSKIRMIVRGYLSIFDPEVFEIARNNDDSILFDDYSVDNEEFEPIEERRRLLDALFGPDANILIRTCGYYVLDIRGHVNSESGYSYPREFSDCIPNPHLQYYNCLGGQERHIRAALERGDVPGAMTQCATSVSSINLGEPPTMERFMRELFGTHKKFLELPDGKVVSPVEALEWLKANEK